MTEQSEPCDETHKVELSMGGLWKECGHDVHFNHNGIASLRLHILPLLLLIFASYLVIFFLFWSVTVRTQP